MDSTVNPEATIEERAAENTLRPSRLSEYAGQPQVQAVLGTAIEAAKARRLGKTTLSFIIANEMEGVAR